MNFEKFVVEDMEAILTIKQHVEGVISGKNWRKRRCSQYCVLTLRVRVPGREAAVSPHITCPESAGQNYASMPGVDRSWLFTVICIAHSVAVFKPVPKHKLSITNFSA